MALSDLAAGLEITEEQRDRGVATVDATADLEARLSAFAADLPGTAGEAATVVEAYADGRSVGDAARAAGLAPITAAKVLHLLGEPVDPLSPTARAVVLDWLDARIPRSDAIRLAGVGEREFVLGAYVQTHDPLPGAREAVGAALAVDAADPLEDARSGVTDLSHS